ncbi:hypothetical protein CK203_071045 [Vitis vinifera]|uniref:Uncharacterized protein n=1 Tax=Vitis vinifera TaxID=29760 RepID=A0A438E9E9_VITVI|nr:hypothetical protein CK203_071045 [Vitis vinifera]
MGWLMASVWGIKGKLRLAWMDEGQALLELKRPVEARKVFVVGKRLVGGIHVDLELWSPSYGCLEEGEIEEEVGHGCSDGEMENLRWARILYCRRLDRSWRTARAQQIVAEERKGATKAHALGGEWRSGAAQVSRYCYGRTMGWKGSWTGWVGSRRVGRIQFGSMLRASVGGAEDGSSLDGLNESNLGLRRDGGPSPQSTFELVVAKEAGGGGLGRWAGRKAQKEFGAQLGGSSVKKRKGPTVNQPKIGPMEALAQLGLSGEANFELEFLRAREKETESDQKANPLYVLVDSALEDEALRYEAFSTLGGLWDSGNSSHSSLLSLGRNPEGEFFDHSRVIREACQNGRESNGQGAAGTRESGSVCWDLVEFKGPLATARELEWGSSQYELQEESGEGDLDWQESSLARFNQFLERNVLSRAKIQDSGEWGDLGFYVYGPFTRLEKECLWEEVGAIRGIWEGPWCLGGDFNITLVQGERSRQKKNNLSYEEVCGSCRRAREEFGNLECNKEDALHQVEYWDRVEDERSLTMEELACKKEAKEGYAKCVDLEETHWRQGIGTRDISTQFSESSGWKADIGSLPFNQICLQEAETLELPFTEGGAEDLGDFRPISLLGGLYKLLAKILDASLIANEVIDTWNKRGDNGVICKLDIEKAYDSINWQFLLKLVSFRAQKGCGKGTPCPLPFCHGDGSVVRPYQKGYEGGLLSQAASGLRINLAKSEIIPVGEVEGIEELAVELGCRKRNEKEACPLEEPIYFKGRENHFNQEQQWVTWRGKLILLIGKWWCGDKENGGLGIRKLTLMNKALLGKWTWRFASNKEALWKQVLVAKYGKEDHGWRTKKAVGFGLTCGVGIQRCPKGSRISTSWQPIEMRELLQALRGFRITWEDDSVSWNGGGSGQFRVKDAYSCGQSAMGLSVGFSWGQVGVP